MTDFQARLDEAAVRNAATLVRIETLKEVIGFHREQRPSEPTDWEEAARTFTEAYVAMGEWLTEALREGVIESQVTLATLQSIHAEILDRKD